MKNKINQKTKYLSNASNNKIDYLKNGIIQNVKK